MRNIVEFKVVKNKIDFWLYFLTNNFPEALDEQTDMTIADMILDKYYLEEEWINQFTKYYDGVFEDNDGYIDTPNTIQIDLSTEKGLFIEFHPGDTIYFIDTEQIGATGSHYAIKKISWKKFIQYTNDLEVLEKLLLLPMVYIKEQQIVELKSFLLEAMNKIAIEKEEQLGICNAIIENCLI